MEGFLRGHGPAELESLRPLGPGSAVIKPQSLGRGGERSQGQTVAWEWVSAYSKRVQALIDCWVSGWGKRETGLLPLQLQGDSMDADAGKREEEGEAKERPWTCVNWGVGELFLLSSK